MLRSIELMNGIPYYCKIGLREVRPPFTLKFRYSSEFDSRITVCGSFVTQYPDVKNYQMRRFGHPGSFRVYAKDDA